MGFAIWGKIPTIIFRSITICINYCLDSARHAIDFHLFQPSWSTAKSSSRELGSRCLNLSFDISSPYHFFVIFACVLQVIILLKYDRKQDHG